MNLRIICEECHALLEFTLDYPDGLRVKPCECQTATEAMADLQEELNGANSIVKERDDEIQSLSYDLTVSEFYGQDRDKEIEHLKRTIEHLKRTIEEMNCF